MNETRERGFRSGAIAEIKGEHHPLGQLSTCSATYEEGYWDGVLAVRRHKENEKIKELRKVMGGGE